MSEKNDRAASHKLVRHVGSVSTATLISRILGYIRDAMVAHAFGGGHLTDAYYAAFRLSNLFRRVLGEGPLATAFVPVFSEHLAKKERKEAEEFFQTITTMLGMLLVAVVLLGMWFSPWIVSFAAHGFKTADPAKFELTVTLTRQMFPFLLFVCLAAISSATLNALGYFFVPSLAPAMLSVATIGYILFIKQWAINPLQGLAISTTLGGVLHYAMMWPQMRKENITPKWRWNLRHPDVLRVAALVLPAIWGLSVDQINAYVDTISASFLQEGSVTALYNSNRLMQFALALFGISISTATLPNLSMCVAKEDWDGMKRNINFSLRMTFYAVLPAMAGLAVLAKPIVQVLFEHGEFTHANTLLTTSALIAYTLGLPAYSAVKVIVTAFYSLKDTRTPVKVATLCLFINMAGNGLTLLFGWGVGGLALATTLASCVNGVVLAHLLRKRIGFAGGRRILRTFLLSSAASALMAAAAFGLMRFTDGSLFWRVPVAVMAGTLLYVLLTKAWRMEEYGHLMDILLRRRPAGAAEIES